MPKRKRWRDETAVRVAMDLAGRMLMPDAPALTIALERLNIHLNLLRRALKQIEQAEVRNLPLARRRLFRDTLPFTLANTRQVIDQAANVLTTQEQVEPIASGTVVAEIIALRREYADLQIDVAEGKLSVQTEPIVLDDVALGAFRIEIDLDRLKSGCEDPGQVISAEALDPNPPNTDDTVTHPHVRHGVVCLGDAAMPTRRALREGRFSDVMHMVHAVLNTYNADSAYVALEDWSGQTCDHCGGSTDSDDSSTCAQCDSLLCSRCSSYCDACEHTLCQTCLSSAAEGESLCEDCRGRCDRCGDTVRDSRLEDGVCPQCHQSQTEEDDETQPETIPTAGAEGKAA